VKEQSKSATRKRKAIAQSDGAKHSTRSKHAKAVGKNIGRKAKVQSAEREASVQK